MNAATNKPATFEEITTAIDLVTETGDVDSALALLRTATKATLRKVVNDHYCRTLRGSLLDDAETAVYMAFNYWQDNVWTPEPETTEEDVAAAVKRTDRGMHKVAAVALGLAPKSEARRMHRPELERMLKGHTDRGAVIAALATAETQINARRAAR